jgi:formylglycine-generating enzyme required for sulfatase activity
MRIVLEDTRRQQRIRLAAKELADAQRKTLEEEQRKRRAATDAALTVMNEEQKARRNASFSIDTSKVVAAAKGKPYINSLKMAFSPLDGSESVSFCQTETSMLAVEAWLKTKSKTLAAPPSFVSDPRHPVVNITWQQAVEFCDWLTEFERSRAIIPATARYRLPTDMEWSRAAGLTDEVGADPAARHQANKEHYIGKAFPPAVMTANLDHQKIKDYTDQYPYAAPVGSMKADAGAFFDMGGNVSEWCQDVWPPSPNEAVVRGPSWISSDPSAILTSNRLHRPKDSYRSDIGFRCVLEFGN